MSNNLFGVTPFGFKTKRLPDIKTEYEQTFTAYFGDVNFDPQSVAGQLIGIFSKVLADQWENDADLYVSGYPNSASGISLDNVVQLNGLTRLPAQRTVVIGAATGQEGTIIPLNSLARTPSNGEVYFTTASATITRSRSIQDVIEVVVLQPQSYTVVIGTTSYVYSLPVLTFSGPIQPGNTINMRLNGGNLPTITYTTDSATTLGLLRNAIAAQTAYVQSATVVGNTIVIVPVDGQQVILSNISVNGTTPPTASVVFAQPSTLDSVASHLAQILNSAGVVLATYTTGATFTIRANDGVTPYSLNVGAGLRINSITSPVPFLAQNYGVIPAPAGSLTDIVTPVAGWTSLTNFTAGATGRDIETDAELRLRRSLSLKILGSATVEAIRARVLQEVPNVTSVIVFENVSITQEPLVYIFNAPLSAGNNVHIVLDGQVLPTIPFTTDNLTTMNLVAQLLAQQTQIQSATVGGTGNQTLTVTMSESEKVVLDIEVTDGTPVTISQSGGRPPKSFETVVEGGTDDAVALKIWQLKPAGIETFGNVNDYAGVLITDSQGNAQRIHFSRAVPVYLWANVTITLNPQETFPANGLDQISNAILAYGNSLGIGIDVFLQRVAAQALLVPGVASATVTLARTPSPTDVPTYVASDIAIGNIEVSVWSLNRINVGF